MGVTTELEEVKMCLEWELNIVVAGESHTCSTVYIRADQRHTRHRF